MTHTDMLNGLILNKVYITYPQSVLDELFNLLDINQKDSYCVYSKLTAFNYGSREFNKLCSMKDINMRKYLYAENDKVFSFISENPTDVFNKMYKLRKKLQTLIPNI